LLLADDALVKLVHDGAAEATIRAHSRAAGGRSLRDDSLRLLRDGRSSLDELLRVTDEG
jgi:general secretion pathway protein E